MTTPSTAVAASLIWFAMAALNRLDKVKDAAMKIGTALARDEAQHAASVHTFDGSGPQLGGGILMACLGFCGSRVRADWPQIEKHCHGHEKEQERLFYAALAKWQSLGRPRSIIREVFHGFL